MTGAITKKASPLSDGTFNSWSGFTCGSAPQVWRHRSQVNRLQDLDERSTVQHGMLVPLKDYGKDVDQLSFVWAKVPTLLRNAHLKQNDAK